MVDPRQPTLQQRSGKRILLSPTTNQWLIRVINALLLMAFAWIGAGLVWQFFAPAPTSAVPSVTTAPNVSVGAQPIDIATIASIFPGGSDNGEQVAGSSLPFKLRGVIGAGQGVFSAAVFSGVGPKEAAFAVGQELQEGVVLRDVQADHAIVENRGRRERIDLDAKPALKLDTASPANPELIRPAGSPSAIAAPARSQVQPIRMPRANLVTAMQSGNVAEWATGLRAIPGQGIKIESGSARGLVQALQLQEGDVLQRINGRKLSHPGDITLVYNEFSQKNKIQLELLRNDRALMLDYTLQP